MNNNALITIIVPAYNVELYFDRCINSILNQIYSNLQIILINDGSTDSTGELCDKYAAIDNRIQVFHQEHRGVSSARNVGLRNCKGDYIGFVDSDDWCEPEMFEAMMNAIDANDSDAARCNYRYIFQDYTKVHSCNSIKKIVTGREAILNMYRHGDHCGYGTALCNNLFRADLFKKRYVIF